MEESFQQPNLLPKRPTLYRWLVVGGIFVLVFVGVLFYWQRLYRQDSMIKFAPVDTVLYAHYQKPFWPWQKIDLASIPLAPWLQTVSQAVGISLADLARADQFSILLVPSAVNNQIETVIFLKTETAHEPVKHQAQLGKVEALASDQFVLNKIKDVADNQLFGLADNVDQRALIAGDFNLYLNSNNILHYFDLPDLPARIFGDYFAGDLVINLNQRQSAWRFDFSLESSFVKNYSQPRIDFIPSDFSFFASGIDLSEVFFGWLANSLELKTVANQLDNSAQTVYGFDWQSRLEPIFNQPADLIGFVPADNFLGFDLVVALPSVSQSDLKNLEYFTSVFLAQKSPSQIRKTLPDGSLVVELIATPNVFVWQQQLTDSVEIRYLAEADLNFEIAYAMFDDSSWLATSKAALEKVISQKSFSPDALALSCGLESGINLLVINSLFPEIFSDATIALAQLRNNVIVGCAVDN